MSPQIKSAAKALRQSKKRRLLNLTYRRKMKSSIKELRSLIGQGKKEKADKLLPLVYKAIDKAAKKGIIKKGAAARQKSRLTIAVGKIGKEIQQKIILKKKSPSKQKKLQKN